MLGMAWLLVMARSREECKRREQPRVNGVGLEEPRCATGCAQKRVQGERCYAVLSAPPQTFVSTVHIFSRFRCCHCRCFLSTIVSFPLICVCPFQHEGVYRTRRNGNLPRGSTCSRRDEVLYSTCEGRNRIRGGGQGTVLWSFSFFLVLFFGCPRWAVRYQRSPGASTDGRF